MGKNQLEDIKITRYMSFDKFVWFLKNGLYLPCSLTFEDKWEGLLILRKLQTVSQRLPALTEAYIRHEASWLYISCWYEGDDESIAMWKLYGGHTQAVAIQTTSEKLREAYLKSKPHTWAYLDRVEYNSAKDPEGIDLNVDIKQICCPKKNNTGGIPHAISAFFLKHSAYAYEKEVRLVAVDENYSDEGSNDKKGITIELTPVPSFIESVRVAPDAGSWYKSVVQDVLKKYDVDVEVSGSELDAPNFRLP